ncbi:MAG: hypothetical protein HC803_08815 [Saprospiraceae bacterium]|nr:hypothetical protein [Saprospiraceae bacterium]
MPNEQEKIERYLNDEMNKTERDTFEEEIKRNKALADKVELNKDLSSFSEVEIWV